MESVHPLDDLMFEYEAADTLSKLQTREWNAEAKEREIEARFEMNEFFKKQFRVHDDSNVFQIRQHKIMSNPAAYEAFLLRHSLSDLTVVGNIPWSELKHVVLDPAVGEEERKSRVDDFCLRNNLNQEAKVKLNWLIEA